MKKVLEVHKKQGNLIHIKHSLRTSAGRNGRSARKRSGSEKRGSFDRWGVVPYKTRTYCEPFHPNRSGGEIGGEDPIPRIAGKRRRELGKYKEKKKKIDCLSNFENK